MLPTGKNPLSKGIALRLRAAAFTFIEILIVVFIIGVIASFSIPRFRETFNNLQLKMAAHDLSQFFRYAQGESIRNECIHKIVIDNHSYWLMAEKEGGEFERTPGRWGRTNLINYNIEVIAENEEIFFYPEGRIDRVEIELNRGEKFYTLTTKERQGYVEVLEK